MSFADGGYIPPAPGGCRRILCEANATEWVAPRRLRRPVGAAPVRLRWRTWLIPALILAAALLLALSGCASTPRVGQHARPPQPSADLRAMPHFAFTPAGVTLTLELRGGEDVEALYGPRIEWTFGDGSRSVRESDSAPWAEGTPIQRRYTIRHCYRVPGEYQPNVSLWRAHRKLLERSTSVSIRWAPMGGPC